MFYKGKRTSSAPLEAHNVWNTWITLNFVQNANKKKKFIIFRFDSLFIYIKWPKYPRSSIIHFLAFSLVIIVQKTTLDGIILSPNLSNIIISAVILKNQLYDFH